MLVFLVQRRDAVNFMEYAVNLDALEALLLQVGKFLAVFAFAAPHDGSQDIKPLAFGQAHDLVHHHGDSLAFNGKARGGRIGNADAREEQAHVVIDLGDRANRGARIAAGGFLFDGNGRRQAINLVHVRLLHHLEELPGVSRQAFHVAALALGIDCVESQRGFARTGKPGEHHEGITWNFQADIFQIVLAGTLNRYNAFVLGHET